MGKPIYSLAIYEIFCRIKEQVAVGKLLYPATFVSTPQLTVEGVDQLPRINFQNFTDIDQTFIAGAKRVTSKSTSIVKTTQTISFLLAFNKDYGVQSPDGENQLGLLDWVSRFKDAVEFDNGGCPDLTLNNTCIEPMEISVENTEVDEISWNIEFNISLYPMPFARATRSLEATEENICASTFPMTIPGTLG